MVSRRGFVAGMGVALAAPALVGRAQGAAPVLVSSLLGADKPETEVWEFVAALLEDEMPGAFAFNIVPNAALGAEREVIEGLRLGSIQAGLATFSALSAWVPETQVFDMPFLFDDTAHVRAALEGPVAAGIGERLASEGLVAPGFIDYGARHLLGQRAYEGPGDMAGERIRIIQSPLHALLWESFGALPIALPVTETYNALATGHVQAMDLTLSAYAGFHFYEVVPEVTLTGHVRAAGAVLFSKSFYDSLDRERQEALDRAAAAGAREFNRLIDEDEARSVDVARQNGARFHEVAGRAAWREIALPVWDAFADRAGGMERIETLAQME